MRYALYFTPPASASLTHTAIRWLGRDAFTGMTAPLSAAGGFAEDELAALTDDPRRYGFHATLKAPFSLANGRSEDELLAAFADFCASKPAFDIPRVVVGQLGPFFALVPAGIHQPLQVFAQSVVAHFEPFRAALDEADIARRKPEALTEAQRANLDRWGYPYVGDEFRFHMTLTGPVPAEKSAAMQHTLDTYFAEHAGKPLQIGGLALFREEVRGAPFTVQTWLPLAGA